MQGFLTIPGADIIRSTDPKKVNQRTPIWEIHHLPLASGVPTRAPPPGHSTKSFFLSTGDVVVVVRVSGNQYTLIFRG